MEEKICIEKHKRIDEKFETQERRINNHSERLDKMEIFSSKLEERLDNLITQLGNLNTTMRWFMGVLVGALVSFFFYAVQQGIFR